MIPLRVGRARAETRRIYALWTKKHCFRQSSYVLGLCAYVNLFMIAFDGLFVANPKPFMVARVATLAVLLPALFVNVHARFQNLRAKWPKLLSGLFLLAGPGLLHAQYYYFVFLLQHEKVTVYFTGFMMVIFYGTFVLHKHWREQYAFNLLGIVLTLPFAVIAPNLADYAYILVVSHLCCAFIFLYFRRDFVDGLYTSYSLLRAMVPNRVAEVLAVSYETTDAVEYFRPEVRYTVCVCADWRGFQTLMLRRTADEISAMLENFYDRVIDSLEALVPSNNYYFSWAADELFVVFFAEGDETEADARRNALAFTRALTIECWPDFQAKGGGVVFDVGIAEGQGLLGLQGPKVMKKTTITGEVAGRAKRYETEAKNQRGPSEASAPPAAVMDRALFERGVEMGLFEREAGRAIRGQAKDIVGLECVHWTPWAARFLRKPTSAA